MSGVDAQTLFCKQANPKLQQVGQIEKVQTEAIDAIIESAKGAVPVIAPVGIGKNGETYNINADWAAARIAQALEIDKLLFLTDQEGICDSEMKLIPELDAGELESLIETGVVKGGMLAKTQTILHALRNGVANVHVLNARRPHGLIEELFTDSRRRHCLPSALSHSRERRSRSFSMLKLQSKHFLTGEELSQQELLGLIDFAEELQKERKEGKDPKDLTGKTLVLLFEKPSLRTE